MLIYCAGPFFNELQLKTMEDIEAVLESFDDVTLFKPRNGKASAKKLNKEIGAGKDPSADTRRQVFEDNVDNIDEADLIVACIDDRDVGTIFEIGYACKAHVPIITYTNKGFGMNLMLAESTLVHCKGTEQLRSAISMFVNGSTNEDFEQLFKRANLSEGKEADKQMSLYVEGE